MLSSYNNIPNDITVIVQVYSDVVELLKSVQEGTNEECCFDNDIITTENVVFDNDEDPADVIRPIFVSY